MPEPGQKKLTRAQRLLKRTCDLVLGAVFLLLSFPLMALITIAIKLDSPGPAILKQIRAGENGRRFGMYKFRSMAKDASEQEETLTQSVENGEASHKNRDDPRTTRIGRFLRRTSLDEIPQLINVLKGEMSLVGPRPELPVFVDQYQPWQRLRLNFPQGITGWWQVNGREKQPMYQYTEYDLYYIEHYSLGLDVSILLKTAWVVLRGKGAF